VTTSDRTETAYGPTLTALMPVRDYHVGYLHDAVGSLLAQSRPDWRLLVIAEPADRRRLEDAIGEHLSDPRIQVVANEGRKLAGAFNTGMRRAETSFVAILHGDDLWSPHAVEVLATSITASPETDFFHSSRRFIDGAGRSISSVYQSKQTVSVDAFVPSSPVKHLLCWNRDKALAIGGMDESLNSVGVDDYDFPWTMAEHGASFSAIPECLYLYRDHREHFRLTTHQPLSHHKREIRRIMRKHGVDKPTVRKTIAAAQEQYLRQSLYRSRVDRWVKTLLGHDPSTGWREPYR
jgi:hypothetical protein